MAQEIGLATGQRHLVGVNNIRYTGFATKKDVTKQKVVKVAQGVSPAQAISLIRKHAFANFNETVEAAIVLSIDPRKPNQNIRKVVTTPHSLGKNTNIAVFTSRPEAVEKSKQLGVTVVGGEDLIHQVKNDSIKLDFTHVFCTAEIFPILKKQVARKLGPKKLMPNEKLGQVTDGIVELEAKINEASRGTIELRNDRLSFVRFGFGKLKNLSDEQLLENFSSLALSLNESKPSNLKGRFFTHCFMSSTMGPGVKVNVGSADPNSRTFMNDVEKSEVELEESKILKKMATTKAKKDKGTKKNVYKNPDGSFKKKAEVREAEAKAIKQDD